MWYFVAIGLGAGIASWRLRRLMMKHHRETLDAITRLSAPRSRATGSELHWLDDETPTSPELDAWLKGRRP